MTMPVATPMAKLTAKIFVQNFVIRWYAPSPVRRYMASMRTMSAPRPIDSGGNR